MLIAGAAPTLPASISCSLAGRTSRTVSARRKRQAGQRVVAIEHHMFGIDLGHGIDGVGGHVGRRSAFGHAIELHAGFEPLGKDRARLEKYQVAVVVAESVLGFEVQFGFESRLLIEQGLFDLGQQVVAADEEFDRVAQFVDQLALSVVQTPDQTDHAGC